jgi:hypothetical protein
VVPTGKEPAYASLWKDGVLNGMVVTGSNLRDLSKGVMDEYLECYRQDSFEFSDAEIQIDDFKGFLGQKVKSGELDYFIKEAHSDGDEKNLFRLDKKARMSVGTKKLPNGQGESLSRLSRRGLRHGVAFQ